MSRIPWVLWFGLVAACNKGTGVISLGDTEDPATDPTTDPVDTTDTTPGDTVPADTTDTTDTPDAPVDTTPAVDPEIEQYEGAELIVDAPEPAELDVDGDGVIHLTGRVVNPQGATLPFEDITWTVLETGDEVLVGRDGDAEVGFGVWTIEVVADLPNGDTLRTVIGGLRVQSPRTGIYAGIVNINATLNGLGVPLTTSCQGSLVFDVNLEGDALDGDGGCDLVFLGINLTLSLTYQVSGDIADPGAAGDLVIDTGLIGIPLGWGGTFRAGDQLAGTFEGFGFGLFGYSLDLTGDLEADRVTVFTTP